MARGEKISLQIGTDFGAEWQEVDSVEHVERVKLLEASQHRLFFKKEKRRGKIVTLVGPFLLSKESTLSLLKRLKKKLGSGGAFKEEFMEFQGDLSLKLKIMLEAEDFRFKKK